MENSNENFAESIAGMALPEYIEADDHSTVDSQAGPGDEDEEEEPAMEEGGEEAGQEAAEGADEDSPPLDGDVVHSPVPPQTGGSPKRA